jgi:hypothetical protein
MIRLRAPIADRRLPGHRRAIERYSDQRSGRPSVMRCEHCLAESAFDRRSPSPLDDAAFIDRPVLQFASKLFLLT